MEMESVEVQFDGGGRVEVKFLDQGTGRTFLLLHGGGGPQTVAPFAERFSSVRRARAITPTHPGFAGTPRPDLLTTVRGLAELYTRLLDELDLSGVTVVGNSIGGWIAAEMALVEPSRAAAFVIVDGVGIEVPGHPIADFFALTPRQVAELSYHDPDRYGFDPSKLAPEALKVLAGNRATLATYAGTAMSDPTLAGRLAEVKKPTLVLWGDSDRIAGVGYGKALAHAIAGAEFQVLANTGHLPQIESPEQLVEAIWGFAERADAAGQNVS
jgi:pimeloyl-ACP methyl ester carboxylesterase